MVFFINLLQRQISLVRKRCRVRFEALNKFCQLLIGNVRPFASNFGGFFLAPLD